MKANFKKLLSLALALIMILALVACGGDPANNTTTNNNTGNQTDDTDSGEEKLAAEQVFGFFLNNEPENLDPWVNNNGEASQIIAAVHEPMLRRDSEGGWIPGLMTDYQTNEDHTVHTLTLREGAKWSDGTDITVEDIVYSYQRALDPELGSAIAYRYFPILNAEAFYKGEVGADELGVKAVDDKTIEITTAEPCDFFVDMMTSAGFAPIQKAAGEKYGDLYGTDVDKVVSSGPFVLTEWTHKNSMVLEKNENYWDAENVKLERVDVTITADTNTLTGMYQSGELGAMRVSNDMLDVFAGENIITNTRMKVTFIEFNPNNEFLANKNIREALSISFNRGDLLFFACQQGWAIYSLIGVRVMARMSALTATAWAGFFGVCWTVLYGLVAGQLYVVPASATCWLSLGYVTLLGGIFAMLAWNVSLRAVGAGKAAIFLNLMPLVGVSAGVLLLDEDFVWQQCFGAVGMLAGIYILTHSHQLMRYANRRLMQRARAISHARTHPVQRHILPWMRH